MLDQTLCSTFDGADGFGKARIGGDFRDFDFPITAFLQAGAHGAHLASFLDNERRAALGAWFSDGLVRSCKITLGILIARVEDAALAFLGHALDEFARLALR